MSCLTRSFPVADFCNLFSLMPPRWSHRLCTQPHLATLLFRYRHIGHPHGLLSLRVKTNQPLCHDDMYIQSQLLTVLFWYLRALIHIYYHNTRRILLFKHAVFQQASDIISYVVLSVKLICKAHNQTIKFPIHEVLITFLSRSLG